MIISIDSGAEMDLHQKIKDYSDNYLYFNDLYLTSYLQNLDFSYVVNDIDFYELIKETDGAIGSFIKNRINKSILKIEIELFDKFLSDLAVYVNHIFLGGRKSAAEGIDIEFDKENIKYIVSVKSAPNWGNSSQIQRMKDDFRKAKRILQSNVPPTNIVAINGCCYGIDNNPDKGEYLKYCGQRFWEFISGNSELYLEIIEPIGHQAKERNISFKIAYDEILNKFTKRFLDEFCIEGRVDWDKLIKFNSSYSV